jgi:hypothetical protein
MTTGSIQPSARVHVDRYTCPDTPLLRNNNGPNDARGIKRSSGVVEVDWARGLGTSERRDVAAADGLVVEDVDGGTPDVETISRICWDKPRK